ncbi:MAG TPA: hypothetical protein VGN64_18550 [Dyadobacter sp.]|jgi:hypothetical protein|nr:hypothetical protein [Dyadobacter sp.]
MSKRLIRIQGADLPNKLDQLQNTEINVVLQNGITYFGKLQSFGPESLTILDKRDHVHLVPIDLVYEIVLDTTAKLEDILNK